LGRRRRLRSVIIQLARISGRSRNFISHQLSVKKSRVRRDDSPSRLYQGFLTAFPFTEDEYPEFVDRIKDYVIQAVREAKVHTAWLRPDSDYEDGFVAFVEQILQPSEDNQFLEKLRSFQQWIAYYGMFNSLSQTLLKMAARGVPDFYQGSELWDLSLVDPDNRRPVDFERRWSYLQDIKKLVFCNSPKAIA
jgi:(1->4)-alpha-D-glucan 1-alpha-D-glucosylmutase